MASPKIFKLSEVEKHNTPEDCWIIIDGNVYDVTKFLKLHPGGFKILAGFGGKDATQAFYDLHRADVLKKHGPKYFIGRLDDAGEPESDLHALGGPNVDMCEHGSISRVPYAEPPFWRDGWTSPYYNESHREFRSRVRAFLQGEIKPEALMYEQMDKPPRKEMFAMLGQKNLLAARLGPGPHLHGLDIMGVPGEQFDCFHELILHEEWTFIGCPAYNDGLATGLVIGLPPVLNFGSDEIKKRVVSECTRGEKTICLAITEPQAGSDVANIHTTAKKTPCGKYFIVNGAKKWITNGTFADYFVTAVRTGGEGMFGISLLLIERSEGVSTKIIKTSYGSSAGTGYVLFEDVKVPVSNILGEENGGFKCIMSNFNHERWYVIVVCCAAARAIASECFRWAMQRRVFGKRLVDLPVVRQKLANMISKVEGTHNWLEGMTYQMKTMDPDSQFMQLGGAIALLKTFCTRMCYEVCDDACQVFGGRSITTTGMGQFVERFYRSIKFGAILGGSEEVMADLAIRMASRFYPQNAKL
mmetsp:Transcript_43529/g.109857  ORF Transcript_43529/g.109857 Transcript_43529/m.109857 type:complete len:528 (-) Transcript_43529:14-1597(-)